ncbi:MAG: SMI1/KNR4 family protein [Clostridiales bacterium]|nr:SMI1/KNR4 family protein [Clostridiales bacterium]
MNLYFKTSPILISRVDRVITEKEIQDFFDAALPSDLIEFWKSYSEIVFENGLNVYGFDIAKERSIQYQIKEYAPNFLLIGDSGDGQGVFIEMNSERQNVFYLGLGALGSLPLNSLEASLFDWLQENPTIDSGEIDDSAMLGYYDLFVSKLPHDTLRFIADVRRAFCLATSIKEIKNGMNNLPYLLVENITMMKYGDTIRALNNTHNCLELKGRV